MDDRNNLTNAPASPSANVAESKESLKDIVEKLRSDMEVQAKIILSLGQTVSMHEVERKQSLNTMAMLQADVYHLAKHLAAQRMEERFEALRCEVSTELYYLRSVMSHSAYNAASSSSMQGSEMQRNVAINHVAQELYHSRKVLWEQIAELREEVHFIHNQLKNHKNETQRRLNERHCKDMCLERMIDTIQAREDSLRQQMPQNINRCDITEIEKKLQAIKISKGKAPKKPGKVAVLTMLAVGSDSDEGVNSSQANAKTPKVKTDIDVCARRK